jgi:hypothetical protein
MPSLKPTLSRLDKDIIDDFERLQRKRKFPDPRYIWNYFGDFSDIKVRSRL